MNVQANFNMAIMYTLTGRFTLATHSLQEKWILFYGPVFIYAFWGSYQLSVHLNELYYLANRENAQIKVFEMNAFQLEFIDKRSPWVAALWSLMMPGLGDIYNRKIPSAVFILVSWILICYKSHILNAIVYSFTGHFVQATAALNIEWTLFLPSILGFAIYNAFNIANDRNTLFDKEQANFLIRNYQPPSFNFKLGSELNARGRHI